MNLTKNQLKKIITQNGMLQGPGIEADGILNPLWYQAPDQSMYLFELLPDDPVFYCRLVDIY